MERKMNFQPKKIGPYVFRGTVGEGSFSIVKLVCHEATRRFYAAKVVPKSRISSPRLRERFEIEIRTHRCLHHPGIVQLYDLLKDDHNFYVILEFCPNGELFQFIVDQNRLSEDDAKPFVIQILEALKYVHSLGISHRDLKPENILVGDFGQMKLSDFGLAWFMGPDNLVTTPCGSPCYASPECLSGVAYDGKATDMWSMGVIVFAMLTGQLPWTKRVQSQLFQQIRKGEYVIPSFLSQSARGFLAGLMTVSVPERLTVEQALAHPWLTGISLFQTRMPAREGCVSLRQVDSFFSRDFSDDILREGERVGRVASTSWLSIRAVTRFIVGKTRPIRRELGAVLPNRHWRRSMGHNPASAVCVPAPIATLAARPVVSGRRSEARKTAAAIKARGIFRALDPPRLFK
jgi:serine/threonine protein kinase